MKNILLGLMVLFIVVGVAALMVGGTFADFSDIEISQGNYIETADLDLKVNDQDDELAPCFDIDDGETCVSYDCDLELSNASDIDGQAVDMAAYLHVKNVAGELADDMDMDIWYDDDGNGVIDNGHTKADRVISERISELNCRQIYLGPLPAGETRKLRVEIHAHSGEHDDFVTFDIAFELFDGYYDDSDFIATGFFSDIETSKDNLLKID